MNANDLYNLKVNITNTIILRTLDAVSLQHPDGIVIAKRGKRYELVDLMKQAEKELKTYFVSRHQVNSLKETDIKEIMAIAKKEFEIVIERLNRE